MTTCGRNDFAMICSDAICCTSTICINDVYTQLMGEMLMFHIAKKGMVQGPNASNWVYILASSLTTHS